MVMEIIQKKLYKNLTKLNSFDTISKRLLFGEIFNAFFLGKG